MLINKGYFITFSGFGSGALTVFTASIARSANDGV